MIPSLIGKARKPCVPPAPSAAPVWRLPRLPRVPRLAALMLIVWAFCLPALSAQQAPQTSFKATTVDGVPEGISTEDWLQASGRAVLVDRVDGQDVVDVELDNLHPLGTYTIWWSADEGFMASLSGLGESPIGGLPENAFVADQEGRAEFAMRFDTDLEDAFLVVALHVDYGNDDLESPELTEASYRHLIGPRPKGEPGQ